MPIAHPSVPALTATTCMLHLSKKEQKKITGCKKKKKWESNSPVRSDMNFLKLNYWSGANLLCIFFAPLAVSPMFFQWRQRPLRLRQWRGGIRWHIWTLKFSPTNSRARLLDHESRPMADQDAGSCESGRSKLTELTSLSFFQLTNSSRGCLVTWSGEGPVSRILILHPTSSSPMKKSRRDASHTHLTFEKSL